MSSNHSFQPAYVLIPGLCLITGCVLPGQSSSGDSQACSPTDAMKGRCSRQIAEAVPPAPTIPPGNVSFNGQFRWLTGGHTSIPCGDRTNFTLVAPSASYVGTVTFAAVIQAVPQGPLVDEQAMIDLGAQGEGNLRLFYAGASFDGPTVTYTFQASDHGVLPIGIKAWTLSQAFQSATETIEVVDVTNSNLGASFTLDGVPGPPLYLFVDSQAIDDDGGLVPAGACRSFTANLRDGCYNEVGHPANITAGFGLAPFDPQTGEDVPGTMAAYSSQATCQAGGAGALSDLLIPANSSTTTFWAKFSPAHTSMYFYLDTSNNPDPNVQTLGGAGMYFDVQ